MMNGVDIMVTVITDLKDLKTIDEPLHLALGVFDGIHIGHRAVIESAVTAAKSEGGLSGVLTFDPHPIKVLAPHVAPQQILASLNHKKELLADLGVDVMIVVSFTKEFASREAIDFLNEVNENVDNLKTLAIGEDWKFGKARQGNIALLKEFGSEHNITIKALSAVMLEGERVSSTRIRQSIRDGNLQSAASMLGREYTVLGTVIRGRQLGRQLGFPTANLRVYNEQLPCNGVWAVEVTLKNGDIHQGVGNLGLRPTVEGAEAKRMLEIHLLDFSDDIYDSDMEVRFLKYVRAEQKFASLDGLKRQIQLDVSEVRKSLG
ncbi:bifunctional riboflavin kinase/FAD synthetase [Akkermansiaceae bacterium]|nr:bifunctional riboflavin kinase/FAD synthetase [Akkermansiaceae bacterium]